MCFLPGEKSEPLTQAEQLLPELCDSVALRAPLPYGPTGKLRPRPSSTRQAGRRLPGLNFGSFVVKQASNASAGGGRRPAAPQGLLLPWGGGMKGGERKAPSGSRSSGEAVRTHERVARVGEAGDLGWREGR